MHLLCGTLLPARPAYLLGRSWSATHDMIAVQREDEIEADVVCELRFRG
jgi:hypothetical protein